MMLVGCLNRPPFGGSASLFIDEGDGLTSERERKSVCMLLSLVAHAVGYKMIVGAHNTVDVRRMWEVFTVVAGYGKCWCPQHCGCPDACGGPYRVYLVWELMAAATLPGKCQRPQHCWGSDMFGRLQGTLLTCLVGTVLRPHRVRSSVWPLS
jgi:hypothetical protein